MVPTQHDDMTSRPRSSQYSASDDTELEDTRHFCLKRPLIAVVAVVIVAVMLYLFCYLRPSLRRWDETHKAMAKYSEHADKEDGCGRCNKGSVCDCRTCQGKAAKPIEIKAAKPGATGTKVAQIDAT